MRRDTIADRQTRDKKVDIGKSRQLRVRTEPGELVTFEEAARLSGLSLSAWVRSALRFEAERRLANAGASPTWIPNRK